MNVYAYHVIYVVLIRTQNAGRDGRVKALKDEFGARTREAETLRSGLERAQGTLDKAQSLIGQLGGEQVRNAKSNGKSNAKSNAKSNGHIQL